jgi:hypothetical protein
MAFTLKCGPRGHSDGFAVCSPLCQGYHSWRSELRQGQTAIDATIVASQATESFYPRDASYLAMLSLPDAATARVRPVRAHMGSESRSASRESVVSRGQFADLGQSYAAMVSFFEGKASRTFMISASIFSSVTGVSRIKITLSGISRATSWNARIEE